MRTFVVLKTKVELVKTDTVARSFSLDDFQLGTQNVL